MRLIFWIIVTMLPPLAALGAENGRGESGIRGPGLKDLCKRTFRLFWMTKTTGSRRDKRDPRAGVDVAASHPRPAKAGARCTSARPASQRQDQAG
jgi:hypothetical protein